MSRFLLVTIRHVAPAGQETYDEQWARLRSAVVEAGGRAWRFRKPENPLHHIEFVEWKQPGDSALTETEPVRTALAQLDSAAAVVSRETWEDIET